MKKVLLSMLFLSIFPIIIFASANPEAKIPGKHFLDFYQKDDSVIFNISMPYGENGKYVFLESNGKVVASTTLNTNTPFYQRIDISYKVTKNGVYNFASYLCLENNLKTCDKSTPVSLIYKDGKVLDERDISEDDIAVSQKNDLDSRYKTVLTDYTKSMHRRMDNIMNRSVAAYSKEANVIRIKKIFETSNLSSIIYSLPDYSVEDFYSLVASYPAFCNETKNGVDINASCSKDLSAYFSVLLAYSNNELKNEFIGLRDKENLKSLLGDDIEKDISSKEVFKKVMDLYMRGQNPEPSMHDVILSLYVPNSKDRQGNISNNFGTVLNIASHNSLCFEKNNIKSKNIADLYLKLLSKTGVEDSEKVSCEGQKVFDTNSASFYPQYFRYDTLSNSCVLDVINTNKNIDKCSRIDLEKDNKILENGIYIAISEKDRLNKVSTINKDYEIKSFGGKKVYSTYPLWRAYEDGDGIDKMPFSKINGLIFEGITLHNDGLIRFNDDFIVYDYPFSGDCLRKDCDRGILNQLSKAKVNNKNLSIIFDIRIYDLSTISSKERRENLAIQISDLLKENIFIDGINITIINTKDKNDGEYLRSEAALIKSALSELSVSKNKKYTLSLSVKPDVNLINNINLKDSSSLFDFISLLAFDIKTPKDNLTGNYAQLNPSSPNDQDNISSFLSVLKNFGVSEQKTLVGIPFYGRIWNNAEGDLKTKNPGLDLKHSTDFSKSYVDYKLIQNNYLLKGNYQYYENNENLSSYLYDGENFISYDSPEIISKKVDYIIKNNYAGIYIADALADNGDLIDSLNNSVEKQNKSNASCKINRVLKFDAKEGMRGADVFALQEYFKCLTYLPSHVEVNGYFGSLTKNALKEFQTDHKLKVTGVLDVETRNFLK